MPRLCRLAVSTGASGSQSRQWETPRRHHFVSLQVRQGHNLEFWNAICRDTFSAGNFLASATNHGSATRSAEDSKIVKYSGPSNRFYFVSVAMKPQKF